MEKSLLKYPKVRLTYSDRNRLERPRITTTKEAAAIAYDLFKKCMMHHEECYALYLDRCTRVVGVLKVGQGNVCGTPADIQSIFQGALLTNAVGLIFTHNHPSCDPRPGDVDNKLTKDLIAAGELLQIKFVDHIIVAADSYYSYIANKEENYNGEMAIVKAAEPKTI